MGLPLGAQIAAGPIENFNPCIRNGKPNVGVNTRSNDPDSVAAAAEPLVEMPPPTDLIAVFLGGLFVIAAFATAYAAAEVVFPLVFAITLKLLLQPARRVLERLRAPRPLAALLIILCLLAMIVALGTAISGPAATWAARLPEGIPKLQERLSFLGDLIDTLLRFAKQAETFGTISSPQSGAAP